MAMVGRSQAQVMHQWTMGPEAQGSHRGAPGSTLQVRRIEDNDTSFCVFFLGSQKIVPDMFFPKSVECFKTTLK